MSAKTSLARRGLRPERWLVEQHDLRRCQQAAADRDHLLLAARQHQRGAVAPRREIGKTLVDFPDLARNGAPVAARDGAHQ